MSPEEKETTEEAPQEQPRLVRAEPPDEAVAEESAQEQETTAEASQTVPEPVGGQPPDEAAAEESAQGQRTVGDARPERASTGPPERRRRRFGRRKVCAFCVEKVSVIDYKDPVKIRRYLSDRGRIEPRRKTGTCTKHQRWLSVALKRARHLALLPYTPEHIRATGVFAARR